MTSKQIKLTWNKGRYITCSIQCSLPNQQRPASAGRQLQVDMPLLDYNILDLLRMVLYMFVISVIVVIFTKVRKKITGLTYSDCQTLTQGMVTLALLIHCNTSI